MTTILTAVSAVFSAMFGASGYVATLVGVITSNDYHKRYTDQKIVI